MRLKGISNVLTIRIKRFAALCSLSLAFVFYGCETVVEVDLPPYSPQIVINRFFSPSNVFTVNVSQSLSILDDDYLEYIDNAVVELYENGSQLGTMSYIGNGDYTLNSTAKAGNNYTLVVYASGYESITASDTVPYAVPIISLSLNDSAGVSQFGDEYAEVTITFTDPKTTKNYYHVEVYEYNSFSGWEEVVYITSTDPGVTSNVYDSGILLSDALFDGNTHSLKINFDNYYLNSSNADLYVRLHSTSKAYYFYRKTLLLHQQNKNNPFAEPVQVYNNVENGLGIFACYNTHEEIIP